MSQNYEPDDVLGCKQAAEVARCHPRTIATWIRKGWLPATKRPGIRGQYRIKYQDLIQVAFQEYKGAADSQEGAQHVT